MTRALASALLLFTSVAFAAPAGPQDSLLELVPARAAVAAVVRKHALAPLRDLMFSDPDMMAELTPYLDRTIGIDLTRLDGVVVFALALDTNDPHFAAVLHIPSNGSTALKLPVAGDAGGTPLYRLGGKDQVCARTKAGLVIGHEAEVRTAVAVDRGREPALTKDSPLGRQLSSDVNEVDLAIAVGPGALPANQTMGVRDGTLTMRHSGQLELVVHGEPSALQMVKGLMGVAMQSAQQSLEQSKEKEVASGDATKGAAAIYTYYQGKRMLAELDPKLEGDALKVRYKMPDVQSLGAPMTLLGLIGVGAAVALPAFNKYAQKSKLASVKMDVHHIATSVQTWGMTNGKLAQLKSTDWSPTGNCCSQPGQLCAISPTSFAAPTWKALGIALDAPGQFRYRVLVDAKKKLVTVEAEGDPDCDGQLTTLRTVVAFSSGTPVIGDVTITGDQE